MSYILDALSKSEQARQQAAAAPRYSLLPAIGREATPQRRWPYALAGTLVVNAAVMYLWLPPGAPRGVHILNEAKAVRAADVPAAPAAPRPSGVPAAATGKPASDVESSALAEGRPNETASAPLAEPAVTRVIEPAKQISRTPPRNPRMKASPVGAQGAQPVSEAIANAGAKPQAAIASAPAPDQSKQAAAGAPPTAAPELPPLTVSGFIHEDGANGMVIVNDRLVREGDEIAPGLKLEKILRDTLVFNYKGYRFNR